MQSLYCSRETCIASSSSKRYIMLEKHPHRVMNMSGCYSHGPRSVHMMGGSHVYEHVGDKGAVHIQQTDMRMGKWEVQGCGADMALGLEGLRK